MSKVSTGWPSEHVAMLTKLWEEGVQGSEIARRLNRTFGTAYTKNAVIGAKHRAGLGNRHVRTPKEVIKSEPQPAWGAVRFINGDRITLDAFIVQLTNGWNKTPTQIAERINDEWPLSLIMVYATHLHVFARLKVLGLDPVKTHKTPKQSNMTGAFGHAPAHYETPPKPVDITKFATSNVDRMGTNERNSCKWPVNDDARALEMCGRFVTVGAYCATHGALAYTLKPSRKRTAMISRTQFEHIKRPEVRVIDDAPDLLELPHASEWLNELKGGE